MFTDEFDLPVAAEHVITATIWADACGQLLDFVGDPISTLAAVNATDERFVLGPVLCAAGRLLGGWSPQHPDVTIDVQRALDRAQTPREVGHAEALVLFAAGEFAQAGARWDYLVSECPRDLLAIRLAHDTYLHNGDSAARLRSSLAALQGWQVDERGYGIVCGQLAFAYEELGHYEQAEQWGWRALEIDAGDVWARHALAHVCESQARHADARALLWDNRDNWTDRTSLVNHVWWHYGLRVLGNGDHQLALEVLDTYLTSLTAFGLCDATSLVWRMDAAGLDVDERWAVLAQRWDAIEERHNSGFIDVHAAVVFARVPGRMADHFWAGLAASHNGQPSENQTTFASVVKPFVECLRDGRQPSEPLPLHRLGGSEIQRSIFHAMLAM